jgi:DNA-binding LytR/AlgR family response regulator
MAIFNYIPNTWESINNKTLDPRYDNFFPLVEISRIESDGAYVLVFYGAEKKIFCNTIKKLCQQTRFQSFIRIHRKHLINPSHVSSINLSEKNIIMKDNTLLPISRRQFSKIKSQIRNFFNHE